MKRKLSRNGQQFHQYQSPLTEHKQGVARPSDVGNAGHALGQGKWIGPEKCIATGYTNNHSKQLVLVVNITLSIHKELVPSHGKVNII